MLLIIFDIDSTLAETVKLDEEFLVRSLMRLFRGLFCAQSWGKL
jgi:hypothetical protein